MVSVNGSPLPKSASMPSLSSLSYPLIHPSQEIVSSSSAPAVESLPLTSLSVPKVTSSSSAQKELSDGSTVGVATPSKISSSSVLLLFSSSTVSPPFVSSGDMIAMQVQPISSSVDATGGDPSQAVFSGVDLSPTLINSEGQGQRLTVSLVADTSHDSSQMEKTSTPSPPVQAADPTATIQDPKDTCTAHDSTLKPIAPSEVCTENLRTTTLSSSSPSQLEKPVAPLTSATSPDTLVDSQSTRTATPIMDCHPSNITNDEVIESLVVDLMTATPIHCAFESSSRFSVLGNVEEAEIEPPNSFSLKRGGRESKPPIKYQNIEWNTVQGRGKRGRVGRGSSR
ncbi:BnaC09g31830D [Brassica napus]|uniref:(rape) hypothetical protein n=1 Tax=Brassica napus TaxID=3708 RepID=A0A078G4M5_BRANA|nr:unnamed protein product [Brassica napus]CDY19917.1 BnaC09g31830D [Brassica napus]